MLEIQEHVAVSVQQGITMLGTC